MRCTAPLPGCTIATRSWPACLFEPLGAPAELRTPNGPGSLPLARRASRIVAGHPEGFTNIYADAAEAIAARRAGVDPDPPALVFPNAVDGVRGVAFVEAAITSATNEGPGPR